MSSLRLTVTTVSEDVYELEVGDQLEVENLIALCEIESGIPAPEISLLHDGRLLHDGKKTLGQYGLADGDILLLHRVRPSEGCSVQAAHHIDASSSEVTTPEVNLPEPTPPSPDPNRVIGVAHDAVIPFEELPHDRKQMLLREATTLREALLSRPEEINILRGRNPNLADALLAGDLNTFAAAVHDLRQQQSPHEASGRRNLLDSRVQEMIAEEIRQKNVEANKEAAMEFSPEVYGKVTMLFIDCKVNGHPVKAFVDSGAQTTIMNVPCAKKCNIMHLLDRQWAGVAHGVGVQNIIGRVHVANIQLGGDFVQSSFSIVENEPLEMLLGLDTLKRHKCKIDLERNALIVGTTGTVVQFLDEHQLPDLARLTDPSRMGEGGQDLRDDVSGQPRDLENLAAALRQMQGMSLETSASEVTIREEDVEQLVSMGFDRDLARNELQLQRGDLNQTVAALLAKSLTLG